MLLSRDGPLMRQTADWMRPADERILEVLADCGNMTPTAISADGKVPRAPVSYSHVSGRVTRLVKYGLVDEYDDGLFRITDTGERFLAGELDVSQLEPLPWLAQSG